MNRLAGTTAGRWIAAICGGFAAGVALGVLGAVAVGLVLASAAAAAAIVVGLKPGRRAPGWSATAALIVLALLGVVRGSAAVDVPGPGRIDGHLGARSVAVIAEVRETQPGGGGPVIVDTQRLSDTDTDATVSGGLLVSGPNVPHLAPGDIVEVDASGLRTPNLKPGPESEATLEREDVEAVAVSPLVSVTRHGGASLAGAVAWAQSQLVRSVDSVLPEPQASLILGIAFGIRQPLATEVRTPLQDAGLIHIVVVSGLKVVMVLGMMGAVGGVLGWSPRRRLLVAIPVVVVYVLLSGAGPAAIRSAVMASGAALAGTGGRRTDPVPMLAICAALMLGIDPRLVLDPGFQLSFLGTAGIVVLARPLARRLPGPRLLAEPFAVTVAAQLATVPVMASTFGVVALLGPVANTLVLPMLPALIVAGGAGALGGAVLPFIGWPLLQLAGVRATVVTLVGRIVDAVPGAAVHIGVWPVAWTVAETGGLAGGVIALWWLHRRPGGTQRVEQPLRPSPASAKRVGVRRLAAVAGAGVVAATACGFVASRPDGLLHVTVLSTGAAPSVLIRTGDGSLALVDGGSSATTLLQALGRVLGPADHRLGLVVVTGGEQAAVAGLAGLPGHYDAGTVIASRSLNPGGIKVMAALQESGATWLDPAGRDWRWGGALWRCLGFRAQATGRVMCALTVADPTGRVVIMGDAGTADQDELSAIDRPALTADLLVTEPGGSLSRALLAVSRPRFVAVPAATGGFAAAAPPGYAVLRTSSSGDLSFTGGAGGLTLSG
ncbi:MAG: ComEC/Rec2 family competence protein [Candidatus Dormibacteraeota bacterium]|nr:ComEC/Rec2 family competence protein [Candidatus Dormibacteraeota bacterium]